MKKEIKEIKDQICLESILTRLAVFMFGSAILASVIEESYWTILFLFITIITSVLYIFIEWKK